jgi:hypothetical protein
VARGHQPQGLRGATGGIEGKESIEYLAEAAALGSASVLELIRETDPDALLAVTAVNKQLIELRDAQYKRLARYIAVELAQLF